MEAKTEPQKRTIPAKALYLTDMHFITNGPAVPSAESSANEVRRVNFTTADGQELLGFYKPLSGIYPELLAKYCVAISVAGRMCLGEAVSDERLVFDKGKIVGTVSVAIPGFGDPSRKLATELSTEEILNTNIIEILVWMMFIQNDDFHPNNISRVDVGNESRRGKAAVFDFDLCLRGAGLSAIKTPRYAELVKQLFSGVGRDQDFSLKPEHIIQFPIGYDATYWPSREYPGNLNIAKAWANQDAFAKLNSKEYAARTNTFMYTAMLKIFMLSDADILEARLIEAFGNTLLDFQDAPNMTSTEKAACASRLMEKAPQLFTTATDREPFYKHFLAMYKQILDHWQHIAFSFKDPREPSELRVNVPRFCDFLSQNQTARSEIMGFIQQENREVAKASEHSPLATISAPLGCSQFGDKAKLSEYVAEQRFLFVWWSSHTEHRKRITDQINKLIELIAKNLSYSLDGSTTSHHSHPQNPLAVAKEKLCRFREDVNRLEQTCKNSLQTRCKPHSQDDVSLAMDKDPITKFCDDLVEARGHLFKELFLGNGNQFKAEEAQLNTLIFEIAALLREPTVAIPRRASEAKTLTETEKNERLFREFLGWLRKIETQRLSIGQPKDFFNAHVTEALKSYKEKARTQERCKKIEKLIKSSAGTEFSIVDSIAFIMSHGGIETTSLNTFLFCNLLRQFIETNVATHNYSVSSLLPSTISRQQELGLSEKYLGFFQTQFLQNLEFEHHFSARSRTAFIRCLKEWLARAHIKEINVILDRALKEYQTARGTLAGAARFLFSAVHLSSTPLRDKEIRDVIKDNSLTGIQKVAKIWRSGTGWEDNSYNTILFKAILGAILAPENKQPVEDINKTLISWLLSSHGIEFITDFVGLLPLDEIGKDSPPLLANCPSESSMSI